MEPTNQGEAPHEVSKLSQVIQIDEGTIQAHLGEVVRSTVGETLNALLDAEADRLCRAERYERTEARQDTRAGSYERHLQTKAGEVTLKVPKLRTLPFETAIIEHYRRRESSVEQALAEMYLAGVSVRRVEDITEALWGTRVSPSTVSELNQKIYAQIGLWLKRSWGGEVRNVSLLVVADTRPPEVEVVGTFAIAETLTMLGDDANKKADAGSPPRVSASAAFKA